MKKEVRNCYHKVFDSDEGKIVLSDIYKTCRLHDLSYVEGSTQKTMFNEGAKKVAMYIKETLDHSNEDVEELIKQSKELNKYNPHNLKG